MVELGVGGLEIAPTAVWGDPTAVGPGDRDAFRRYWEDHGVRLVAFQALLYGRPDLQVFSGSSERARLLEHLSRISALAGALGVRVLVFGSPSNRRVGDLEDEAAWQVATDFFRQAGEVASGEGTTLCIEPNPPEYGCDFVTTAAEGLALVQAVNVPGFRLHLDAAAMAMADDDPVETFRIAREWQAHFHASEPYLSPLGCPKEGTTGVDHTRVADALRSAHFDGWCSLEMRCPPESDALIDSLRAALTVQRRAYG